MKILNHLDNRDKKQLSVFDTDDVPFQFLPQYTNFYLDYYKENLNIAYSTVLDAYIPLRVYKSKMFRLGRILHAPFSTKNNAELSASDQLLFFNELISFLKQNNLCERLVQPHPYAILSALPPNSQYCEFGTYIIDLANQTNEEIFKKFDKKYQKAIDHSQKNCAQIKIGSAVFDDFYQTYLMTMHRVNQPAEYKSFFTKLYIHLGENRVLPGVVYDQGNPIGCVFFIFTKYAAFCTHAGSQGNSKLYGAMKLLHYEMMRHLKNLDVKRYDLVGVRLKNTNPTLEGIFRFKKGFGGDIKAGYLWKTDLNPLRAKLYDLLVRLKNRNKTLAMDIIDQVNA